MWYGVFIRLIGILINLFAIWSNKRKWLARNSATKWQVGYAITRKMGGKKKKGERGKIR